MRQTWVAPLSEKEQKWIEAWQQETNQTGGMMGTNGYHFLRLYSKKKDEGLILIPTAKETKFIAIWAKITSARRWTTTYSVAEEIDIEDKKAKEKLTQLITEK